MVRTMGSGPMLSGPWVSPAPVRRQLEAPEPLLKERRQCRRPPLEAP